MIAIAKEEKEESAPKAKERRVSKETEEPQVKERRTSPNANKYTVINRK